MVLLSFSVGVGYKADARQAKKQEHGQKSGGDSGYQTCNASRHAENRTEE
jgi:hypothetical protein